MFIYRIYDMATRWKPPHFSETFIVAGFFYKQKIGICKKKKKKMTFFCMLT